jgi:hypothetical protein
MGKSNCGMRIADCGIGMAIRNPQSEIRNWNFVAKYLRHGWRRVNEVPDLRPGREPDVTVVRDLRRAVRTPKMDRPQMGRVSTVEISMDAVRNATVRSEANRLPVLASLLLTIGLSALAIRHWYLLGFVAGDVRLFAALAVACCISTLLRMGWMVPCLVFGTFCGILLDPLIKGGTVESQMWETVTSIATGAVLGLCVGLALEVTRSKGIQEKL